MSKKIPIMVLAVCLWVLLGDSLCGCGNTVQRYDVSGVAMGTIVTQTVYTRAREGRNAEQSGEQLTNDITRRLREIEEDISWRMADSQVSKINGQANDRKTDTGDLTERGETGCELSSELAEVLTAAWQVSKDSEGAFDLTVAPVVRLWDIDKWTVLQGEGEQPVLPTKEQILAALSFTGYEKVRFEVTDAASAVQESPEGNGAEKGTGTTEIFLPEGFMLDLGAIGKGLACDEILKLLEEGDGGKETNAGKNADAENSGQTEPNLMAEAAIISLGGNILTYGDKPDGTPWKVGVTDPFQPSRYIGTLTLSGTSIVTTSGDYERYVELDGKRYHHIIDPATGYPAETGIRSVTIWSGNLANRENRNAGLLGDALSTACFVLGQEKAMALAEKYGVEILLILEDGQMVMSQGMKSVFSESTGVK